MALVAEAAHRRTGADDTAIATPSDTDRHLCWRAAT